MIPIRELQHAVGDDGDISRLNAVRLSLSGRTASENGLGRLLRALHVGGATGVPSRPEATTDKAPRSLKLERLGTLP